MTIWASGFCAEVFGAPKIAEMARRDAEPYGDGVWGCVSPFDGDSACFGRRAEHVNNSGACDSGLVVVVSKDLGAVSAAELIHRTVTSILPKMYAVLHSHVTSALSCKSHRC